MHTLAWEAQADRVEEVVLGSSDSKTLRFWNGIEKKCGCDNVISILQQSLSLKRSDAFNAELLPPLRAMRKGFDDLEAVLKKDQRIPIPS